MKNRIDTPRIFISYSWTTPKHEEWVRDLAERLLSDGIDVILDKWGLKEGHDKYAFMEKMVTDSNVTKVLIICDEDYARKADERKGGVGTESQIISREVYEKVDQEKFIPIIKEKNKYGKPYLPTFLNTRIYIDLSSEETRFEEYQKLVRNLFDKPAFIKPPIGTPPSYISSESTPVIQTGHRFSQFKDSLIKGHPNTKAFAKEYLTTLLRAMEDFKFNVSEKPETGFDDKIVESIRNFKPYRDEFVEFVKSICLHSNERELYEDIFGFFEKAACFLFPGPIDGPCYESWFDNINFILRELFVYLISILIKNKRYQWVNLFLKEKYYYSTRNGQQASSFAVFERFNKTLDEYRKNRLQLNRFSITADLIKERADLPEISFDEIMQTDFILCVRYLMLPNRDYMNWYPRTLVFIDDLRSHPFELFFKAQSKRHFEGLKILLEIKNKEGLARFIKQKREDGTLNNYKLDYSPIPFETWLNLENLDKD